MAGNSGKGNDRSRRRRSIVVRDVRSSRTMSLTNKMSDVNDDLAGHLERIRALSDELAQAVDDPARQRHVVNRLGLELDAARRAIRPHFYR